MQKMYVNAHEISDWYFIPSQIEKIMYPFKENSIVDFLKWKKMHIDWENLSLPCRKKMLLWLKTRLYVHGYMHEETLNFALLVCPYLFAEYVRDMARRSVQHGVSVGIASG